MLRAYLVVLGTLAFLAQLARLAIAWSDFRKRWHRLPADAVYRQPKTEEYPVG
jgi:hypothetical protein